MGLQHARVLDTHSMPWESGLDYLATLAPAFRDNLGPVDQVAANFGKYRQKNLYLDRDSTLRALIGNATFTRFDALLP